MASRPGPRPWTRRPFGENAPAARVNWMPMSDTAPLPRPQPMVEYRDVDRDFFRHEIATRFRPAVMRGLVRDWPAVRAFAQSPAAFGAYLGRFDNGRKVDALAMPRHARGRVFYNDDLSGFNYQREQLAIGEALARIDGYARFQTPPGLALQSAPIAECLPGFMAENRQPLLEASITPRIWIGNAVTTPAHFDESHNIACVIAGRRRFTLFPPEQIANLYIGPLGHAPTGTPISMVSFAQPDLARHPRFREALANAQAAELEPGDAIYIPPLWWHHVESLARLNALVNYWWKGAPDSDTRAPSALDCLLHSMLNLRHLSPEQKAAWRAIYDHYVFNPQDDAGAHLPAHARGVLGPITPALAEQVRAFLLKQLQR